VSAAIYQQINLYQPIFRRQRQIFSAMTMLQAGGIVAAALLGIYFFGLWQVLGLEAEAVQLEGREKAYAAQFARLDTSSSLARRREVERELEHLNDQLVSQQRLIEVLRDRPLGSTDGFSSYLEALARQHRSGLWLTELRINGASRALELVGRTIEPNLVAEYLQDLGQEPALAGQLFDEFEVERGDSGTPGAFKVSSRAVGERIALNAEPQR
jgi:Tfp pilus assembly protein PilN